MEVEERSRKKVKKQDKFCCLSGFLGILVLKTNSRNGSIDSQLTRKNDEL